MVFLAAAVADHSICGLYYLLILYLATDTSHRYAQIRLCLKCLEDSKIINTKCFRLIFLMTGWEGYNDKFNVSCSLKDDVWCRMMGPGQTSPGVWSTSPGWRSRSPASAPPSPATAPRASSTTAASSTAPKARTSTVSAARWGKMIY